MNYKTLTVGFLSMALIFSGCGKKADPNKPIDQVQKEAQTMNVQDLQKNAEAYARAIQSKKSQLEKESEKLKSLSPKDMLSDKGKEFRDNMAKVGNDVQELTKRYEIYAQAFAQKGGDMSKIKIS